jgi:protoporphyrinogen oxidase
MDFDCIVVGAGLSGITAAREMQRYGISVLLIESSDQVGGRVRSDRIDQYICDRGFQVINPKYPQVAKSGVLNGLDFRKISGQIRVDDLDIKVGYNVSSLSFKTGKLSEKLRFLAFIANSRASNQKKFSDYIEKFPDFYNRVLAPFLTGVFLTDPKEIAADVAHEILRSFVKSLPGIPARGVGEFSMALAVPIENLKLNETVESIAPGVVFTNHARYTSKFIVIATDPVTAYKFISSTVPIQMLSSTTTYFSTTEKLIDSRNLVISNRSKLVNSIVISEVSEDYAPVDKSLISATSLGDLTESQFKSELAKLWRTNTNRWESITSYQIKNALPFHPPFKNRNSQTQINDWLFMVGDHMATPSQQGAMNSGAQVAIKINQLMQ